MFTFVNFTFKLIVRASKKCRKRSRGEFYIFWPIFTGVRNLALGFAYENAILWQSKHSLRRRDGNQFFCEQRRQHIFG